MNGCASASTLKLAVSPRHRLTVAPGAGELNPAAHDCGGERWYRPASLAASTTRDPFVFTPISGCTPCSRSVKIE
jgi:hypothetical protein